MARVDLTEMIFTESSINELYKGGDNATMSIMKLSITRIFQMHVSKGPMEMAASRGRVLEAAAISS